MDKQFFHFKSDIEFNLYINGEYVARNKNRESIDLVVGAKSFSFMLCPLSSIDNYMIDNGIINIKNKASSTSSCTKIVPFKNNHYDIIFMPQKVYNLSTNNIVMEINQESLNIFVYNCNYGIIEINIKNKSRLLEKVDYNITASNLEKIYDCYLITNLLDNGKRYVLVVTENGEKIFDKLCDEFEINGTEIKTMSISCDIASSGRVDSINITDRKTETYYISLTDRKMVLQKELIPLAFLQALQNKNYTLAKLYLSDNFSGIQNVQLDNYFGKVDGIYYNRYLLNDDVNYTIWAENEYRSFDFEINNNLIEDIKEVQLNWKKCFFFLKHKY